MSDTILIKGFDAELQLQGLAPGEFAIDPPRARMGLTSGLLPLDLVGLPAPSGDVTAVYQWNGSEAVIAPLRAGGGSRPPAGGAWRVPGLVATANTKALISATYEVDVEVTEPSSLTGLAVLPEFSGGFNFGIRAKPGFAGVSRSGDLSSGTNIQSVVATTLDAGRYTVFIEPLTSLRFASLRGSMLQDRVADFPVYLRIE